MCTNDNLVAKYEILKQQVVLENKARREWMRKWGVYVDHDKTIVEEAATAGLSKEEYLKLVTFRKDTKMDVRSSWDIKINDKVPQTSAGMVGWRGFPEYSLEKAGRFYISPLHTLPAERPITNIILG